ncbi:MAG: cytochrome c3 family protein [Geopsychrobacter sp.]|nr:cytochrome c3 family protein [Geopsychrobacter sp.]
MKKILLTIALVALMTSTAFAAITGSKHDFSGAAYATATGNICIFCHTPHNSDTTVANAPLWNHEVTAATYTLYSGQGTLNATMAQPSGISKLCLSCHDGTVAIDSFGGATGTTNITGAALLGTDLSNDHPVSFLYDAALNTADSGIYNPTTQASGLGSTIDVDLLFGATAGSKTLECASCHDVHRSDETVAFQPMLRKSNTASALCLTCHNK